jgi:hypothetical protein
METKTAQSEIKYMELDFMKLDKIMNTIKPTASFAFGTMMLLGCLALPGIAQSQPAQDQPAQAAQTVTSQPAAPLGDYARKARKEDQGKAKTKVFDNDNLPREDKLSIVGPAVPEDTTTASDANAPAAGDAKAEAKTEGDGKTPQAGATPATETKPATKPEDDEKARQAAWKEWQDKLKTQKDQIDLLTRELDVLQREYQIRAAAMYADAGNRLRNSAAWDKQDADYKQQIADKQKTLDDAKQKLDDMDEQARKAGVPNSMREP